MQTLKYRSEDIHCERCAERVVACLTAVGGVVSVDVDVPNRTITVEVDDRVSDAVLRSALDEAGFEVAG